VRAWWEASDDEGCCIHPLRDIVADAEIRERVLSYQQKLVKSPEATNQDRQNYRNLLKYLKRVDANFLATSLLDRLNRVKPSSLNYGASIGRVLRQHELPFTEFEIDAISINGGFFEIGSREKPIVIEHAPDGKWYARNDLWLPYVLATTADRARGSNPGVGST